KETGFNTGIFLPDLTDSSIALTLVPDGSEAIDDTGVFVSPSIISSNDNLNIVYSDPAQDPSGPQNFQQITVITHITGSISSSTSQAGLNSKFPLTITDNDLNTNSDTKDSFTVNFDATHSSPTLSPDSSAALTAAAPDQVFDSGIAGLTMEVGGNSIS